MPAVGWRTSSWAVAGMENAIEQTTTSAAVHRFVDLDPKKGDLRLGNAAEDGRPHLAHGEHGEHPRQKEGPYCLGERARHASPSRPEQQQALNPEQDDGSMRVSTTAQL